MQTCSVVTAACVGVACRLQPTKRAGWLPSPAQTCSQQTFNECCNALRCAVPRRAVPCCRVLKSVLRPFGRLQQLQAYANSRTLVSTVGVDGIEDLVEEQEEELRCEICGRYRMPLPPAGRPKP